jgi:predicted XRE-type DNA-binding protein
MTFGTKRFTQLRIAASLGVIEVRVRSMVRKEIVQFVRELETAKMERSQHPNSAVA